MNKNDYNIAIELKDRLSTSVPVVDFMVFGSRARGDADKYSDLDVFIELENTDLEIEEKIEEIVWEVGYKYLIYISPLIFSRFEIEKSPLRVAPIVRNIVAEGVRI